MTRWNCKIGKVTPRLALHRGYGVDEPDIWDDGGFVENVIQVARSAGSVTGYAVIATHDKGTATIGTRPGAMRANLQMIGALTVEAFRRAQAMDEEA